MIGFTSGYGSGKTEYENMQEDPKSRFYSAGIAYVVNKYFHLKASINNLFQLSYKNSGTF